MDKVVHFEIPVDDAARAKEFYRTTFDWELNDMDMGGGNTYTTVTTAAAASSSPGRRFPIWAPSRTSRTPRGTWSGCGRTSDPQLSRSAAHVAAPAVPLSREDGRDRVGRIQTAGPAAAALRIARTIPS